MPFCIHKKTTKLLIWGMTKHHSFINNLGIRCPLCFRIAIVQPMQTDHCSLAWVCSIQKFNSCIAEVFLFCLQGSTSASTPSEVGQRQSAGRGQRRGEEEGGEVGAQEREELGSEKRVTLRTRGVSRSCRREKQLKFTFIYLSTLLYKKVNQMDIAFFQNWFNKIVSLTPFQKD